MHDLKDFSLKETDYVLRLVNATCEQYPRSKIAMIIEVKVSIDILKSKA
jgi:hypothetical protein